VIYLDVRTLPNNLPVQAFNEVRDMIKSVVKKNPQLEGTKAEIFLSAPGTSIPDDHELVQTIISAHSNQLGKAPQMGTETWYSDAAHMNRYGIPTVNYGSAGRIRTGGGGFSTAQGEHTHIGDMMDIVRVYIEVMMKICGVVK
jgi:acetylornithine deacetylase/succinyl-diaminopimelate desuccinylase-like protein